MRSLFASFFIIWRIFSQKLIRRQQVPVLREQNFYEKIAKLKMQFLKTFLPTSRQEKTTQTIKLTTVAKLFRSMDD